MTEKKSVKGVDDTKLLCGLMGHAWEYNKLNTHRKCKNCRVEHINCLGVWMQGYYSW